MTVTFEVERNAGHPWDGRQSFDGMCIEAETVEELSAFLAKAESKYWATWIKGIDDLTGKHCAYLYKPSGITQQWTDDPNKPYTDN